MINVRELFDGIDIYLFDQILKGRFKSGMSILDAGCGGGRNLTYFLRNNYEVFAVDENEEAIENVRSMSARFAPNLPGENFQTSKVESMPFGTGSFDAVLSSAVLHFARDEEQFRTMVDEMWRVLRSGGIFFARTASSIGIEKLIKPIGGRRFLLPDGSERFLVSEEYIDEVWGGIDAAWLEPVKTTNVQNLRCMTTLVLRKKSMMLAASAEKSRVQHLVNFSSFLTAAKFDQRHF